MATYLVQVSYTPQAWAAMIANPQDRTKVVGAVVKKLGGKMQDFWLAFGDYDVVGIIDMPDSVSAAAFSIAVGGGGACRSVKTTPLLSMDEGMAAMKKAGTSGYKPVTG